MSYGRALEDSSLRNYNATKIRSNSITSFSNRRANYRQGEKLNLHTYSQVELENPTKRYHIDTFVHLKDGNPSNCTPLLNPKYLVTPYHLQNPAQLQISRRVIVLRAT